MLALVLNLRLEYRNEGGGPPQLCFWMRVSGDLDTVAPKGWRRIWGYFIEAWCCSKVATTSEYPWDTPLNLVVYASTLRMCTYHLSSDLSHRFWDNRNFNWDTPSNNCVKKSVKINGRLIDKTEQYPRPPLFFVFKNILKITHLVTFYPESSLIQRCRSSQVSVCKSSTKSRRISRYINIQKSLFFRLLRVLFATFG